MAKNKTHNEEELIEDGNPEGDRPVNTDTDTDNPQDDQADIEAPIDPEDEKDKGKGKKKKSLSLKTTKEVAFTINGKKSEGTEFDFESEEDLASRKQMLIERYGADVIEE